MCDLPSNKYGWDWPKVGRSGENLLRLVATAAGVHKGNYLQDRLPPCECANDIVANFKGCQGAISELSLFCEKPAVAFEGVNERSAFGGQATNNARQECREYIIDKQISADGCR
jgi:hypothetical protein